MRFRYGERLSDKSNNGEEYGCRTVVAAKDRVREREFPILEGAQPEGGEEGAEEEKEE